MVQKGVPTNGKVPKAHKETMLGGKRKDSKWVQKVESKIEQKGTEGVFSAAAKKHGMTTPKYAAKVIKELKGKKGLTDTEKTLLKRAVLARTFSKMRH